MFSADLAVAEVGVRGLVAGLDPDAIPLCEVLAAWKTFNAIETLAASAKTLLARRVEDGNAWRSAGYRSAAEQLAAIAGSSVTTEKKAIETSKRVRKLPKTAAAMRNGRLSPAKAEAIASAVTVAPAAEDDLLDNAEKAPLGELREKCLKARAVDVDKARKRIHRDRCARVYRDGEGAWNLYARGPVDLGAGFMTVLQRLTDEQFMFAKAEGREEPIAAYAFDALMKLADLAGSPGVADAEPAKKP